MKTGRYCLKDLLTHNEIDQIIIPEIQRDYVWQKKNVRGLLESIAQKFSNKSKTKIEVNVGGTVIEELSIADYLQKEYDKLKNNLKLGFIYAYHDADYAGKFFLIDGQQRFTTLYLLLLAVYCKNNQHEKFKELYFKNNVLKIDYKVRESSHEFMKEFVRLTLDSNSELDISNSNRYYTHLYEQDITIKNLINNYNEICSFVNDNAFLSQNDNYDHFLEFIEEYIEVNYFDTNLSEQGEQLYMYMNSRGEFLSHHETIKSEIVRKVTNTNDKKQVGDNWETWQNYFWQNRGSNESADIGFDEFLKWTSIIHICTTENPQIIHETIKEKRQTSREAKENYIHRTKPKLATQQEYLAQYQARCLEADFLNSTFNAVDELFQLESKYIPIEHSWLNNIGGAINYIRLLPLIYFIKHSQWENEQDKERDIERLSMFLYNITYFESISKNPDSAVITAIEMVKMLCDRGQTNIACFANDDIFKGKFKSVLTAAELEKLNLFNDSGALREELEKTIWDISLDNEISTFLKGDISLFIFTANKFGVKDVENKPFINSTYIQAITQYSKIFKDILKNCNLVTNGGNSDLFRRALLTFGDFCIETQGSYRFGSRIDGFSFAYYYNRYNKEWEKSIIQHKNTFADFLEVANNKSNFEIETFLNHCIDDFSIYDWRTVFIKEPSVLEYCYKKRYLYSSLHRIFLIKEKEMGYKEVQCLLLKDVLASSIDFHVKIHNHNICFFDFKYDSIQSKLVENKESNGFALDIIKGGNEWKVNLLYREVESLGTQFSIFIDKGWIIDENNENRIYKKDEILYRNDENLTIRDNVNKLKDQVSLLYKEIEEIFKNQHNEPK